MSKTIVIGGLGGSGTRAVAQVLMDAGLFMGSPLNPSNDNLLFTQLFKNPIWFNSATPKEIEARLQLFDDLSKGKVTSDKDYDFWNSIAENHPSMARKWPIVKNEDLTKRRVISESESWGWKEPNSHIFLENLISFYPNLHYIHVLRNGLDMAFSGNQQQLQNWGNRFGIELSKDERDESLAIKQMEFWMKSTKRIREVGEKMDSRLMFLNYTELCRNPKEEIDKIIGFAGIVIDNTVRESLYNIPNLPSSHQRYKSHSMSLFTDEQLEFVEQMGFSI